MTNGLRHSSFVSKETPPMPCVTVPLNLFCNKGTGRVAFDFQLRPVGYNRNFESQDRFILRFKECVEHHEPGRENLFLLSKEQSALAVALSVPLHCSVAFQSQEIFSGKFRPRV